MTAPEHVKESPKPKTPRAVTLWRHACLTTPVVKTFLLQPPSEQTATTPKPSSFRNFHFAQAEGKCPESPPPGGASHRSCSCAVAKRLHERDIAPRSGLIPQPPSFRNLPCQRAGTPMEKQTPPINRPHEEILIFSRRRKNSARFPAYLAIIVPHNFIPQH